MRLIQGNEHGHPLKQEVAFYSHGLPQLFFTRSFVSIQGSFPNTISSSCFCFPPNCHIDIRLLIILEIRNVTWYKS